MDANFQPRISAAEFWADITTIPESGCWVHLSVLRAKHAYGHALVEGASEYAAHRIAFALAHGPVPEGLSVLHKCDVKGCINPDHLEAGTQRQNLADFYARGFTPAIRARKAAAASRSMKAWWATPGVRDFLRRLKAKRSHARKVARPAA